MISNKFDLCSLLSTDYGNIPGNSKNISSWLKKLSWPAIHSKLHHFVQHTVQALDNRISCSWPLNLNEVNNQPSTHQLNVQWISSTS